MKQFFSLLKATTKGDLNIFRFKGEGKSKFSKIALVLILSVMMMFVSYSYADIMGEPLRQVGLTYILLTIFSLAIVLLNIMETIYKSQGIIFDAKDNNLLFSLPIKRTHILTVRILKLLAFDYIFQFIFLVPCFIKYILVEMPGLNFYLLSLLFFIVLPFLPLIIGCIIGYLIKAFSSIFKNKKMIQTVISLVLFLVIYGVMFNIEGFANNIASKAESINDLISKIYLPIGLYVELIQKFDFIKLLELLLISVGPFIVFIYIFQFKYDSIINNSKETTKKSKKRFVMKSNSPLKALVKKEIKSYFSIPIYVINTIIGPLLAIIAAVFVCLKYDTIITSLTSNESGLTLTQINTFSPLIVIVMIMLLTSMTSITSSSISLEGKKIGLTKSLPVEPYKVFLSKIITSDILIIPFMLLSAIILIIKLQIFDYNIIFILLVCVIFPHLIGQIGLLVNLKYPKLNYNSEVEVVKQSIATFISLMIGLLLCMSLIVSFGYVSNIIGNIFSMLIYLILLTAITIYLDKLLKTYGTKKYNEFDWIV